MSRQPPDTVTEESEAILTQAEIIPENTKSISWEELQDSLRRKLLKLKPHQSLRSSQLAELYIRGLVKEENDEYRFDLSFDLHGFDCGAPDCYSTDLTFAIPATKPISYPAKIPFRLHEYGCVDKETRRFGDFEIVEQTPEFINLYSETERSNLLIFATDERNEFVYYFSESKPDSIRANLIGKLLEEYDETDPNVIAPYRITTMLTNEYEQFLN